MDGSVKDLLMASDPEFKRLALEHTQYSQRLDALSQKRFLSEDEKLEEVRLKKLKLKLKDEMTLLEHKFQSSHQQHNVA
jgi:uncharacterized protein YdcH (DUF465 family)